MEGQRDACFSVYSVIILRGFAEERGSTRRTERGASERVMGKLVDDDEERVKEKMRRDVVVVVVRLLRAPKGGGRAAAAGG